jgi:hypothetical protein
MKAFKPKRVTGADLHAQIAPVVAHLPAAVPAAPAPAGKSQPAVVQVNFKASPQFAALIAQRAAEAGSTRRYLARLMAAAGEPVPENDLNPPDNRRKLV